MLRGQGQDRLLIRRVDRSPARPDGAHCCGPLRLHGGVELLHGKSGGGLLCRCHVARLGPRHDRRVASPVRRRASPRPPWSPLVDGRRLARVHVQPEHSLWVPARVYITQARAVEMPPKTNKEVASGPAAGGGADDQGSPAAELTD
jgi:hypothetical protein